MSSPILGLTGALCLAACPPVANPPTEPAPPLSALSQEVSALQVLYSLDVTRPQLEALKKLAAKTAAKPAAQAAGKGSDGLRKKLTALRDALVDPKDDDRIGELMEDLDKLRDAEKPELADEIDVTEDAVLQAPAFLRTLSARQVASYVAGFAAEIMDPREHLLEALQKVRGLSDAEWGETRDDVAEDVSHLVAGLDEDRAAKVRNQVIQLLIIARSLKPEEFKKERSDLEKQAQEILGNLGPTDVLRHIMERVVAELLSNPRLPAALDARLKK